jgi:predicted nucleotidyltransferase
MNTGSGQPTTDQQAALRRFVEACEADERVIAAFLGGSFARGTADAYSDLDIYAITTDEGYDGFFAVRHEFVRRLGNPVYLDDFNDFGFDMMQFTFEDGVEGELALARESRFDHIHGGPHTVLVDKKGLLEGRTFAPYHPAEDDQRKALRHAVLWFWDNLSYFVRSVHRGQLWTAYGSLNEMRMKCLKLARLRQDFATEHTAYSGVESILPAEELRTLELTCTPLDRQAMVEAARVLVAFYRQIAPPLASEHGIEYPAGLERVVLHRLDELPGQGSGS